MKTSPLPAASFWSALFLVLLTGCATTSRPPAAEARPAQTYAIILYVPEDEELDDQDRAYALAFARDTLLASGLVTPVDVMIDDVERAQLLFRARMEHGRLVEIAGVPSVSNTRTVVLSQPRYLNDRIFWDASYPYGFPPSYDSYYGSYPVPGPGWGSPAYPRQRERNRPDRDGDRDRDHDHGRPGKPTGDNPPTRPLPDRDQDRDHKHDRPHPNPDVAGPRDHPRDRDGDRNHDRPVHPPPSTDKPGRPPLVSRSNPTSRELPTVTANRSPAPERSRPTYTPPPSRASAPSPAPAPRFDPPARQSSPPPPPPAQNSSRSDPPGSKDDP